MEVTTKRRAAAARPRKAKVEIQLSPAEKELAAMKVYISKITSSKKNAVGFLKDTGVIDSRGALAKPYRP